MSLFSFKKEPTLSFVFDIRDTYVTIGAVRFEKDNKPELVFCQNFKIERQDITDHEKYLDSMIKTIENGVISIKRNLIKMGSKEKIGKYFFFVGSPWSISESKMIKIVKDKPFEISNSFLGKIINGEEEDKKADIEKMSGLSDWTVLEEKVIQSKINGYKADAIFGKKTKDLEIELFVSFINKDVRNKLSALGSENFRKYKAGRLNSCTLSSYSFLRDLYSDKNDFIYIDVGDLVTDAYVVKGDVIQATVSIPVGKKEIIKSISAKSKTPEDIIVSALHISHRGDTLSDGKIVKNAKDGIKIWLKELSDSISRVCAEVDIPKNIFVITKDELTDILVKEIKDGNHLGIFSKDMEITNIDEKSINDLIKNGKVYINEPYIKMDLVFLDKIIH